MSITEDMHSSPIPVLIRNSYITHSVMITISIYTLFCYPNISIWAGHWLNLLCTLSVHLMDEGTEFPTNHN